MSTNDHLQSAVLKALERAGRKGSLRMTLPDGREHRFSGDEPGPHAVLVLNDWRTADAVARRGDCGLGEAYMQGWWDSPDLEAFVAWTIANTDGLGRLGWGSRLYQLKSVLRDRLLRRNTKSGSRRNILAHYDLGNDFYKLWLDPTMSYSSGIYARPDASLVDAQEKKYGRILGRLGDRDRVLEIGCGWGGFVAQASGEGRRVTALTISEQQFDYVRERTGGQADVRLQDYRLSSGRYPAIVSIEMLEAVGEAYWPRYFRTLRERLDRDGVAVIQTITIRDSLFHSYRSCTDYIREHIFPGGMLPTVPRIAKEAERAGLAVSDVHSFGQDYARTLREWHARFDAAEPQVAGLGYDTGFRRGWRLYLGMCAAAFAIGRTDVHQIELRPV
jgi:cyclopropane-fatty-acyl-phospholipid synthase